MSAGEAPYTPDEYLPALAAVGLRPSSEVLAPLGQEVRALAQDDEQAWFSIFAAAEVAGFFTGDMTDWVTDGDGRFRQAAGLYSCDCSCDCWTDECTKAGCPCPGCAGPRATNTRTFVLRGTSIEVVPWTALFRALHFGPWGAEFTAALDRSGLMSKLLIDITGVLPPKYGPIAVDPEPLVTSPTAYLDGPS